MTLSYEMFIYFCGILNSTHPRKFVTNPKIKIKKIDSDLTWSVFLLTAILVITVVKIVWTHAMWPSESATTKRFFRCMTIA